MMGIVEFGEALLRTGDLDPIYIMLHHSGFPMDQKYRWCVAYWCYYSAGVASAASELKAARFWQYLQTGIPLFPRGRERRHFRGFRAEGALEALRRLYPQPEVFIEYLKTGQRCQYGHVGSILRPPAGGKASLTLSDVLKRVQEHTQFGPWIAFKVADMMERVLSIPVDFSSCDLLGLYEEPRAGAELAAKALGAPEAAAALQEVIRQFQNFKAPPSEDRAFNIAEAETVLCKWKAHLNGHYPVGQDTREIRHALYGWECKSAKRLLAVLEERCVLPGVLV